MLYFQMDERIEGAVLSDLCILGKPYIFLTVSLEVCTYVSVPDLELFNIPAFNVPFHLRKV